MVAQHQGTDSGKISERHTQRLHHTHGRGADLIEMITDCTLQHRHIDRAVGREVPTSSQKWRMAAAG